MWDRAADWWAGHLQEDKNRRLQVFPTVLRLLAEPRGLRVLDAGCGEGSFARILAEAGSAVTGVDFSRLLDVALEYESHRPLGVRYVKADLGDLNPLLRRGEAFDAVVCNLVLHCIPVLDPVLRSLYAQLKPGGLLVISDLHPDTFAHFSRAWTSCMQIRTNEYRYTLSADCPELTLFLHSRPELESALARSGFSLLERLTSAAAGNADLPQFVYYRLQKALPEHTESVS
jgi:2-polyprenyl-3-methyl-5-hydroxy-6-metoxy-1,4-benzoquinol methylase